MKMNIKTLVCVLSLGVLSFGMVSCNKWLDMEPISQITPESYFNTADQLAAYATNYYNTFLTHPYNGNMYHSSGYNDGLIKSDINTDIVVSTIAGNTTLFADNYWTVPSSKNLQSNYFANIRVCNYFFEQVLPKYEAGEIDGNEETVASYIGEMYFFRALIYYNAMVVFGDFPIVVDVLPDNYDVVVEASKRSPRNEVCRFILEDLDTAISMLSDRSAFNGQRINKQCAQLFKSRVALYEATFEKYHKGSGRVPGDSNWPGATATYNSGKTFDIDGEINFFLNECINAAKEVADNANLTENTHKINPDVGTIYNWNPYFEMFSQPSLSGVDEVLLWKQYDYNYTSHDATYRCRIGCCDGFTRTFAESFLMKSGLPIYADSNYKGDVYIDDLQDGRDERLQLFVWGESTLLDSDPSAPVPGAIFIENGDDHGPAITSVEDEKRCITGYQPRKYYTYDYSQNANDALLGTNACPIFRTAEAMLNYMEAYYELYGSLNGTATTYWNALRERAGITGSIDATIAATDLDQEGDFGVYSGTSQVDPTLYNIRRERMNELFCEGLRYPDLLRWRSFDNMLTTKWIPEGINFWDAAYERYSEDSDLVCDGSSDAIVSSPELSKYLRPYSRIMSTTNDLRDGYNWHEAYYLTPISVSDMLYASPDGTTASTYLYQNLYWPTSGGGYAEK